MLNLKLFIKKNPVIVYFVLTFAWAWVCWLPLILTTPPGSMQAGISPAFIILAILGGFGPSLAGFGVSALIRGKVGVKNLWGQVRILPAAPIWVVTALCLVPAVSLAALLLQSIVLQKPVELGDIGSRLAMGLIWPLFSSMGEEFGWRGFALPGLLKSRRPLAASLVIGLVWGLWHLPTDFIGLRHYGAWFIPYFILAGPINLTVQSLIMTWIYTRSHSLLPVILYHYSITACAILLPALQLAPLENIAAMGISVLLFTGVAALISVPRKSVNVEMIR